MHTLVINPGSTTLKFKLFAQDLKELISGGIYKESEHVRFEYTYTEGDNKSEELPTSDFNRGAELIKKVIGELTISKIGFRVVHGAEVYTNTTLITPDFLKNLSSISSLAPLHNPPALDAIKSFQQSFPEANLYAVFDTAFHSTIPSKSYMYPLPYKFYEDYKIRRYGFHGTSVEYVTGELKKLEPNLHKTIVCHLGGGASITAVQDGKSIDTSMGFTPLEGLMMATRSGDVDNGILYYLIKEHGYTLEQFAQIENHESGLLGISGLTSDMKTLLSESANGNARAQLAIDMYVYRIQKYIGSYAASMNGVDSLVFTAGIGAGSDVIRAKIIESLSYLNLHVDSQLNDGKVNVKENLKISSENSHSIWVIPTNEELMIATKVSQID